MHSVIAIGIFWWLHLSLFKVIIGEELWLFFLLLFFFILLTFLLEVLIRGRWLERLAIFRLKHVRITRSSLVAHSRLLAILRVSKLRGRDTGSSITIFFGFLWLLFLFFFLRCHELVNNLLKGTLTNVLVAHLRRELSDSWHFKLFNFQIRLTRVFTTLLRRRWLRLTSWFSPFSFFSSTLCFFSSLFSFILGKSFGLKLGLLLFSFNAKLLLDLLTALFLVDLEGSTHVSLEVIIELIHSIRVGI